MEMMVDTTTARTGSGDLALRNLAIDAAIWGVPIVSFDTMRQAFFRDAGATHGDFAYLSRPADCSFQLTTPNASSHYVYFNFNLSQGPLVLEVPEARGAGLVGSLLDAWQVPIADIGPSGADKGWGGRYLLLPPGTAGDVPLPYLPVRLDTLNGYGLFRAIPEDSTPCAARRAIELIEKLHLYPLFQAAAPPPSRHIDISGTLFDGITRFDQSYFESLARMVDEEPPFARDCEMFTRIKALGIEQGKPFEPDEMMIDVLREGAQQAQALLQARGREDGAPYWPDRHWRTPSTLGARTGFTFEHGRRIDTEARALFYFLASAPPSRYGKASFYLSAWLDAAGVPLSGDARYRLHVPPSVPARQFWAVTLYDCETAAFARATPKAEINSYARLHRKRDGSVELKIGGEPPEEHATNWLPTVPGAHWFAIFRFYGPGQPLIERRWKLPDFERVG